VALTACHRPGVRSLKLASAVARLGDGGVVKPGLERTAALLRALGHPEKGMRGVLVAGTNGKGSVCAVIESVCRHAGLRTALLTNPHLRSYCERIAIGGAPISEDAFIELLAEVRAEAPGVAPAVGAPSQFELLTAAGVLAAARAAADILICEVGVGGRLDSTNVLDLGAAVITNVSLDHEAMLGNTVELIAAEKAAIIKPGNDVITASRGSVLDVIIARADQVGANLRVVGRDVEFGGGTLGLAGIEVTLRSGHDRGQAWSLPLRGHHQIANAAVALATCQVLAHRGFPLDAESMTLGAAAVNWPGRMEWRAGRPALLLDGAHNPAGMKAFATAAADLCRGRRRVAIFGAMADKNIPAMLAPLRELTDMVVFTRVEGERAETPEALSAVWGTGSSVASTPARALEIARGMAGPAGVVMVAGSLYLVGAVLERLDTPSDPPAVTPWREPRRASP